MPRTALPSPLRLTLSWTRACPPASTGSDHNLRISEHSEGNAARGRAAVPQNHRHFVARLIVPTVRRPTWEVSHAEHHGTRRFPVRGWQERRISDSSETGSEF